MKFFRLYSGAILGSCLTLWTSLFPSYLLACMGSTIPPTCPQSAYVAKFAPATIINPVAGGAVNVPIGVVPFGIWDAGTFACAQPNGASLNLTLVCTPVGGGAAITIGPQSVPVAVPTTPGRQPVLTGAGGAAVNGGPYIFTIPAGTLAAGSYTCPVTGSYSLGFGAGIGSGSVTGTGDAEVCIVEPAPSDATVPRLDLQLIEIDDPFAEGVPGAGPGYRVARRGDQVIDYYLLSNNDLDHGVAVTLSASSNQTARQPTGDNNDDTLFAISSPTPGTDNFPLAFGDAGGDLLIDLPDPFEVSDQRISQTIRLPPGGLTVIPLSTRSHGMCADGSCSETTVRLDDALFDDGSQAVACSGSVLFVDNAVAPQSPLCEITDHLMTGPNVDSRWSPAVFGDPGLHLSTHAEGNVPFFSEEGQRFTQTTSIPLAEEFNSPYSPDSQDNLRTEIGTDSIQFLVEGFPQNQNFALKSQAVNVMNMPASGEFVFPLMYLTNDNASVQLDFDAANNQASLFYGSRNDLLFEGPFDELLSNPPSGLVVDHETFREIIKQPVPDQPVLGTVPLAYTELIAQIPVNSIQVDVLDPRNQQPLAWQASSDNPAVSLRQSQGNAGTLMTVDIDVAMVAKAPDVTIALIEIHNADAINSPVFFPIAVRLANDLDIAPLMGTLGVGISGSGQFVSTESRFHNHIDIRRSGSSGFVPIADNEPAIFGRNEQMRLRTKVHVDPADQNISSDILAVALHQSPAGLSRFMRDGDNWVPWDGNVGSLTSAVRGISLGSLLDLPIYEGPAPVPGDYLVFIGYRLQDMNKIVYNQDNPLTFTVR